MAVSHLSHHDRQTCFRRTGRSGPTLLCVHGSGATHAAWKAQLARLTGEYQVVALDLSGHGDSEDVATEAGPETLDAYAEDVLAVAEETDADVLVGNSLGGAVVQHLLLDYGFDAEAAALVGSGAKLGVSDDLLSLLDDDYEGAVAFVHEPGMLFYDPDERTVAHSKEAMRAVGQAVTRRDYRTCDVFDVRDRLDEIGIPVLAVTGEHDGLTPPWFHEYLAENLPDCRQETIPAAAHLSMMERPDVFNEVLSNFLADEV